MNRTTLGDLIERRRADEVLEAEAAEFAAARQTARILAAQVLPSEEAIHRRLAEEAERRAAWAEVEKCSRGRLDLEALLRQSRGDGSVPRWMVYDPLVGFDTIRWGPFARITFEHLRDHRVVARIATKMSNPFSSRMTFTAHPILLPALVRERILQIKRDLPEARCLIVYEPRTVNAVPVPRPDPALVAEVMGGYFVLEIWEDPTGQQEDPRALHTLREFYVQDRRPPWLQEKI